MIHGRHTQLTAICQMNRKRLEGRRMRKLSNVAFYGNGILPHPDWLASLRTSTSPPMGTLGHLRPLGDEALHVTGADRPWITNSRSPDAGDG